MWLEQVLNIYSVAIGVVGLIVSLFFFVKRPRLEWILVIISLLGNFLSNYYWAAYMLLIGDSPNVSSLLAYFGWDLSYIPIIILLLYLRKGDEKRFFSPFSLIPLIFIIPQFCLYLQFGGIFNTVWQCLSCAVIICLSINGIIYRLKNKQKGVGKPYVHFVLALYVFFEYSMWTASCYDWPSPALDPYIYFALFDSAVQVVLPLALFKALSDSKRDEDLDTAAHRRRFLPYVYIGMIILCCVGGYLLAVWMRDTLDAGIAGAEEADPYLIIAVMLFVFSAVLELFIIAIILVVSFSQKNAESEKLKQAKLLAEKSNAAKSDFLTNMSHEIRTPINAVLGMNEMIMRESLEARDLLPREREAIREVFSKICGYSGNIESAGHNLLSIINDILDFSKIESGNMELVNGSYKLSSVLNDVSNMIAFRAKDKGLDFVVDIDDSIPDGLYGDELRVRQIITNLLSNAVKYTRNGSVTLSVSKSADAKEGETVLGISVKDTGIGIKPEDKEKLFNKFTRVDLAKNSTVEGTGLGLAITSSLLEMMGGTIDVESEYGKGSEFRVAVPQRVVSYEPVGNFREKYEKSIESTKTYTEYFRAPDAHILIVDDTRMNLIVAENLLRKTEVVIDTAISGDEAIALAEKIRYDVILMDQRMPGMDGTEAMKHIKEQTSGANVNTPFICLTADAVIGARDRYIAQGFSDYLTKPINSSELEKMVMHYIPAEKIITVRKEQEKQEEIDPAPDLDVLKDGGIDTAEGLGYCQGDSAFYGSVLREFVSASAEKKDRLDACLKDRDLKDYSTIVHSIKSSAKLIGVKPLSELAAKLEEAADSADIAVIEKEHPSLISEYSRIAEIIRSAGYVPETDEEGDDGEVLEFIPETND